METRMTIKFSDITGGGIPYGNNAGRPANPATGKLYSNGETQRLELYTAAGSWENIVQEVPGVSSISGNYSEATDSGVILIYGTNFVNGAVATAIGSNGVQVNAQSTVYNSLVQLTATFAGLSNAYEPYDIKVTNPSNLFGLIPDALYINASPVWQTSSGSLGTFTEQVSITLSALSATDSDSNTITYALASGSSLPSGVTLNSATGVISGTLPDITSSTTYTFTINTSDGLNVIPRTFSITSAVPEFSGGGTLITSDPTYFYRVFTSTGTLNIANASADVEAIILGGGGGGGASFGGGGGSGALVSMSTKAVSPGVYSIVVGEGAAQNAAANSTRGLDGQNSSAFGVTALGGGGGGSYNDVYTGRDGGCGGGGASSETSGIMLGGATTQQSQTGTTFYGNRGGNSFGRSPYIGTGGGGTGAQGQDITGGTTAGNGGNGTTAISSWLSVINSSMPTAWQTATSGGYIGGGGAGASYQYSNGSLPGSPGAGGGGTSTGGNNVRGGNAVANTGSGGGGGGYDSGGGGAGGKGLVIVRYPKNKSINA
jgi:hypothetical protein